MCFIQSLSTMWTGIVYGHNSFVLPNGILLFLLLFSVFIGGGDGWRTCALSVMISIFCSVSIIVVHYCAVDACKVCTVLYEHNSMLLPKLIIIIYYCSCCCVLDGESLHVHF